MMLKFMSSAVISKGSILWGHNRSINRVIKKANFIAIAGFSSKVYREYESFNEELNAEKAITIPEFFLKTVERFQDRSALVHKDLDSDKWISITYKEYHKRVEKIAKAFIKLGLQQHGSVAVLAFNCPEWFISQLAANHAGGQIVGVYLTNSSEVCFQILESSKSNIVVVDDNEQLNKILAFKDKLPHLKSIVKILPPFERRKSSESSSGLYSWKEVEEMNVDEVEKEYRRRMIDITPNDCCSLCYTSGTTGTPKGAILTHDNLVFEINSIKTGLQSHQEGNEVVVSYLPLAHMSGQLQDILISIRTGATVYFADRNAFKGTLIDTLKEARPTCFGSVPRLFEKFYERISHILAETSGVKRTLVDWARKVTLQYHLDLLNGRNPSTLQYEIAKKLVINKIKQGLGFDRTRVFFAGASPLSIEILHFFLSLDINLQQCYGMTENSGIAAIRANWQRELLSVGKPLPGVETKILNPDGNGIGEICTRGRNTFKGYYNDIEKTKEALDDDGWLHSGDLGYFDKDGYLFVTGRIKELIITAGGENIPFLHIENLIKKECSAISNAFLIGDKRKFLTMLITLKTEVDSNLSPTDDLAPDALKLVKDLNITKLSEAHNHPRVIELIQAAVDRANKNAIANFQKVQKFAILPHEFSIASGEFSPTMKLKRGFLLEKYAHIIDKFYN